MSFVDAVDSEKSKRTLDSNDEANEYFGGTNSLVHVEKRMAAFVSWFNEYFDGIRSFRVTSSSLDIVEIVLGQGRVGILPINTALFSFDDYDHEKLWVGRQSIDESTTELGGAKFDLCLTAMHHPIDWLNLAEQSHVKQKIRNVSDAVLSGHLHQTDGRLEESGAFDVGENVINDEKKEN